MRKSAARLISGQIGQENGGYFRIDRSKSEREVDGRYRDLEPTNVDQIHDRFVEMHRNYYTYEWTWAYGRCLSFIIYVPMK